MATRRVLVVYVFFFQAKDGIRDIGVTGVQTCALPISRFFGIVAEAVQAFTATFRPVFADSTIASSAAIFAIISGCVTGYGVRPSAASANASKIGRASCRERV